MRLLLLLWLAASSVIAGPFPQQGQPGPDLQPPPAPVQQQVATKRFGFTSGGDGESVFGKIAHWFFPTGAETLPTAPGRSIARSPYVHGPPPRGHPLPPPQKFYGAPPRHKTVHPPPPPPPPQLKCNPCNKVPWVPIPHAQYQDGGKVFAVVNAPQLHQGLHGASQPNAPVYHHSPLPQGYLPSFGDNKPVSTGDQALAPSAGAGVSSYPSSGSGSAPEIIPSIPVADFISSIEYPVNVVQSPIIDLGGSGNHYKSLDDTHNQVTATDNHASNHNTDNVPASTGTSDTADGSPQSINPLLINTEIGGTNHGSSYQNVNLHAEHTEHKEVQTDISIAPSVQTELQQQSAQNEPQKHENVQVVYRPHHPEGTVHPPSPIPTQQQPPLPQPPVPFHIPTFQQPPSAHAPTVFNPTGFPVSGPPPRFIPHHQQPPIFFNSHLPSFQHQPPRGFSSPGQINSLRQVPSAPDLSPPPPPQSGHPYRFEVFPPSGNSLLHNQILSESPTVPPTIDYTPWQTEQSTALPPTTDVTPLPSSHAVSSQNNFLDLDSASGLRNQWHHREINHQFQESRIQESRTVNATTASPLPVTSTGSSTTVHVLASDIRALLRAEQTRHPQKANPNLLRLQNNIDQWTAQEFSNDLNHILLVDDKHKATTAAGTLAPSKIIPKEYFSTSPSYTSPTPTTAPISFFDHEAAGSIAHNVHAKTKSGTKITRVEVDTTTDDPTTTVLTTTEEPGTTTVEPRRTTWEQALLGYSSTTKEKVYVVTPMNTHQWTDLTTPTPRVTVTSPSSTTTEKVTKGFVIKGRGSNIKQISTTAVPSTSNPSASHSPRFTIRPTPGPRGSVPPSAPGETFVNRGNRFYTVPAPSSYQTLSTTHTPVRSVTIERRSTSVLPADLSTLATASPPEGQNVHISAKPSKVVTVVTSSSSSSSLHGNKKATRLEVKPVVKIPPVTENPIEDIKDIEIAAAVREVSAIELKRKVV